MICLRNKESQKKKTHWIPELSTDMKNWGEYSGSRVIKSPPYLAKTEGCCRWLPLTFVDSALQTLANPLQALLPVVATIGCVILEDGIWWQRSPGSGVEPPGQLELERHESAGISRHFFPLYLQTQTLTVTHISYMIIYVYTLYTSEMNSFRDSL